MCRSVPYLKYFIYMNNPLVPVGKGDVSVCCISFKIKTKNWVLEPILKDLHSG